MLVLLPIALIIGASAVDAKSSYLRMIPNGDKVPNPCGIGMWNAVGHGDASSGGVSLNQFGRDFAAAGRRWTGSLCQKDSDGDGRTNGDELGDPNCVWTVGSTPSRMTNLGHPGICEPLTLDTCKLANSFLTANNCEALSDVIGDDDQPSTAPPSTRPTRHTQPDYTTTTPVMTTTRARRTTTEPPNPWLLHRYCTCYCRNDTDDWSAGGWGDDEEGNYDYYGYDDYDDDEYGYDDYGDDDSGNSRSSWSWPWSSGNPSRSWASWNSQTSAANQGRNNGQRQDNNNNRQGGNNNNNSNNNRNLNRQRRQAAGRGGSGNDAGRSRGGQQTTTMDPGWLWWLTGYGGNYYGNSNNNYYNNRPSSNNGWSSWSSPSSWSSWTSGGGSSGRRHVDPPLSQSPEFNNTELYAVRRHCTCACPKN